MNLYQLTNELQAAFDRLQTDPETGEILNFNEVDNLELAFGEKAEAYAVVIKNKLALAAELKQEIKTLQDRCKAALNVAERMKNHLAQSMQAIGKDRLETARTCVSFRKSTQVQITDETQIPHGYMVEKIERKPDKTAIKKALANGEVIAGAELVVKNDIQIK